MYVWAWVCACVGGDRVCVSVCVCGPPGFWHSNCFVTGCLSPPVLAYQSMVSMSYSSPHGAVEEEKVRYNDARLWFWVWSRLTSFKEIIERTERNWERKNSSIILFCFSFHQQWNQMQSYFWASNIWKISTKCTFYSSLEFCNQYLNIEY